MFFQGAMFIVFQNVPGTTFIQGATLISESRVGALTLSNQYGLNFHFCCKKMKRSNAKNVFKAKFSNKNPTILKNVLQTE